MLQHFASVHVCKRCGTELLSGVFVAAADEHSSQVHLHPVQIPPQLSNASVARTRVAQLVRFTPLIRGQNSNATVSRYLHTYTHTFPQQQTVYRPHSQCAPCSRRLIFYVCKADGCAIWLRCIIINEHPLEGTMLRLTYIHSCAQPIQQDARVLELAACFPRRSSSASGTRK